MDRTDIWIPSLQFQESLLRTGADRFLRRTDSHGIRLLCHLPADIHHGCRFCHVFLLSPFALGRLTAPQSVNAAPPRTVPAPPPLPPGCPPSAWRWRSAAPRCPRPPGWAAAGPRLAHTFSAAFARRFALALRCVPEAEGKALDRIKKYGDEG